VFRRGLRRGNRQKGQDIGPFRFALRKIAKNFGKLRPGAEAALEGAVIEFSQMTVDTTGGDFMVSADSVAPIFEQFGVLEAQVQGVRAETRSPDGLIPSGEELRDLMLGDSGEGGEFGARGCAASSLAMATREPRMSCLSGGGLMALAIY
jgi:hypothetical protein